MISTELQQDNKCMYRKIGTTEYVITVKQTENATESAEDILARLIATEYKEVQDG